ncbi:MAG: hypothetical protein WCE75_02050, partial [Terracidiphilus sp.]
FHTDPFLFEHEGQPWLFYEDFDYGRRRGSIACARLDEKGEPGEAIIALQRPYHLSYPCLFRDGAEIYLIPETRSQGTVEVYRARRFPFDWELAGVQLRLQAVDTTAWQQDGAWWFFVTLREPRGEALQLWLFHADSVLGEWQPHPASPIHTDVRRSRGAGAIFREGDRLIRPSQDCSGNYGRSFSWNEILVLNREEYRERPLSTVEAPPGFTGIHTYARLGALEVIDGCAELPHSRVLDWPSFLRRMGHRLRLVD